MTWGKIVAFWAWIVLVEVLSNIARKRENRRHEAEMREIYEARRARNQPKGPTT